MIRLRSIAAVSLGLAMLGAGCAMRTPVAPASLLVDPDRAPDEVLDLWPGEPPGGVPVGVTEDLLSRENAFGLPDHAAIHVTHPTLSVFRPEHPDGSAILIIPGGGYARVVIEKEGFEGARWFNRQGVTAYVLKYRLPADGWAAGPDAPLQDAQRAMRLVRSRAAMDGIDPERVAVMGFSAGGHVAGSLLTHSDDLAYEGVDPADQLSARPAVGALIYPVASMSEAIVHAGSRDNLIGEAADAEAIARYSVETAVTQDTPPTFLLHAADDSGVPVDNSLVLFDAYAKAGAPVALHVFETGGHGFGFRGIDASPLHAWPQLFLDFARDHGLGSPSTDDEAH